MVEVEVEKIIHPSTQVEFGYMEACGFESRNKLDGGRESMD